MQKHLVRLLLTTTVCQIGFAQVNNCRTEILKQFRTVFKVAENLDEQESFMQGACQASKTKGGLTYEGVGISVDDIRQACQQENRQFFKTYWKQIAFSYLPLEALAVVKDICTPGGPIVMSAQEVGGTQVNFTAKFNILGNVGKGTPTSARVYYAMYDKEKLDCDLTRISAKASLQVGTGGVIFICKRLIPGKVSFILSTSQGDYSVESDWTEKPTPKPKPTFTLTLLHVDDAASCKINGIDVGGSTFNLIQQQGATRINITNRVKQGNNTVSCTVSDHYPGKDGCPCWGAAMQIERSDSKNPIWRNPPIGTCGCGAKGPNSGSWGGATVGTFSWNN